jgi:photosystem II stability/assembly factor-like uncharacterized protein
MNRSKEKTNTIIEDEDTLPPLDDDEIGAADPEELAEYLDIKNDDGGFLVLEESFIGEEELFSVDSLQGATETSLIDNQEHAQQIDGIELAIDDEESGWSEDGSDASAVFDGDWFLDGDDHSDVTDDSGAEGPIGEDVFDLDNEQGDWQSLDEDLDREEEDEILDTLVRLGIELPLYDTDEFESIGEINSGLLLDCTFLGPKDDAVITAAFDSGAPVALGDGLFVLGADGMLHAKVGSERLGRITPTSLCIHDPFIFIGTECGGVVRTQDRGDSYTPLNSWYTRDLSASREVLSDRISTSVQLVGQRVSGGYRLVIRTDEGQLFVSDDSGDSWRGPLLGDRCLAIGKVGGTQELIVLTKNPKDETILATSHDLSTWRERVLPDERALNARHRHVCLAACRNTVVIMARDASLPAYISLDRGESWAEVRGIENVTAFAIDPEDPTWMVAATYDPTVDLGIVYVSDDGGRSWQTILATEGDAANIQAVSNRPVRHMNRVSDLIVDIGRTRQITVVTASGIYLVTLARPGVAH